MCDADVNARFFKILLGGLIVDVSNVTISGKGRRYRKNWLASTADPDRVDHLFADRCVQAIRDVAQFHSQTRTPARVINGDARTWDSPEPFDLAIFSPPYPNSFDYTDVYNVQLWMLGYLRGSDDNRRLRASTLASHVQIKREYDPAPVGSRTLSSVMEQLAERRTSLWNQDLPEMVGAYFADLSKVLSHTVDRLNDGAKCWLVVGDSSYAGVNIPVATILSELSSQSGCRTVQSTPIRHMKGSAQQGWKQHLAESLLVLQR